MFLACDNPVVLAGIKSLLTAVPDPEIVSEARDGPAALQLTKELTSDVVLMGLSMPGLNSVGVARQLLAEVPDCKVLALTEPSLCAQITRGRVGRLPAEAVGEG